jgi:hypothetical protein
MKKEKKICVENEENEKEEGKTITTEEKAETIKCSILEKR